MGEPLDQVERARRALELARADRLHAERESVRILASYQQTLIDAELRDTRRRLLRALWHRAGRDTAAFLDEDFLAVADRPAVIAAIVTAAMAGGADMCDLQVHDPRTGTLEIAGQHGFTEEFLTFFETVARGQPGCSCGRALAGRRPVLVDDITLSPIFAGEPSLEVLRAAGSRSVHSYPLFGVGGEVTGVLSVHYRTPGPPRGRPDLVAAGAGQALALVGGP